MNDLANKIADALATAFPADHDMTSMGVPTRDDFLSVVSDVLQREPAGGILAAADRLRAAYTECVAAWSAYHADMQASTEELCLATVRLANAVAEVDAAHKHLTEVARGAHLTSSTGGEPR